MFGLTLGLARAWHFSLGKDSGCSLVFSRLYGGRLRAQVGKGTTYTHQLRKGKGCGLTLFGRFSAQHTAATR